MTISDWNKNGVINKILVWLCLVRMALMHTLRLSLLHQCKIKHVTITLKWRLIDYIHWRGQGYWLPFSGTVVCSHNTLKTGGGSSTHKLLESCSHAALCGMHAILKSKSPTKFALGFCITAAYKQMMHNSLVYYVWQLQCPETIKMVRGRIAVTLIHITTKCSECRRTYFCTDMAEIAPLWPNYRPRMKL